MLLSQALSLINPPETEKTAATTPSAAPGAPATTSSDAAAAGLRQALKEATADVEAPTKTAGQGSPIDDLTKLAADVAASEHEAMTKEAQLYGASVCDGFMIRLAQYNEAAQRSMPATPDKTASAVESDSFEKFAAANPNLVREAHDLGYEQTRQELHKLAEAAYLYGHNGTVEWIHKTASGAFMRGFEDTLRLIEAAR